MIDPDRVARVTPLYATVTVPVHGAPAVADFTTAQTVLGSADVTATLVVPAAAEPEFAGVPTVAPALAVNTSAPVADSISAPYASSKSI